MKKQLFLILALLLPMVASATPEPYAVLDIGRKTATFYYDENKASRGGIDINNSYKYYSNSPYGGATTAIIDASFADYRPTSTAYWFYYCYSLTSITGMENLHTDNVTDMRWMFRGCSGLTSLDVSGFKTDNVTSMSDMFSGCKSLTSLDVSGFKTDNVTNMSYMFSDCSGLTSLDVSGFKTDNVTYMWRMFYGCKSLTSLDVSGFNTDNVTNMGGMFYGCSGLTSLDVSGLKTDNVTNMDSMFGGCSSLTSLDVSGFKTDNVTYMNDMFYGCSGLKTIYVGNGWNTDKVTEGSSSMFYKCTSLVGGKGTAYDESHTDHTYARIDGGEAQPGYFTEKAGQHEGGEIIVFADANVKAICVTNWDTNGDGELSMTEAAAVTDIGRVFQSQYSIKSFDELQYFTGLTSIGDYAFFSCGLTSIIIPNSVTSIGKNAFSRCNGLTSITLPENLKSIGNDAFEKCFKLASITIPDGVTTIGETAFYECSGLTSLTIPNSVISIGKAAFRYCYNLASIVVDSGNTYYDSRERCNAIISKSDNELIAGCNNTTIPNSVRKIGIGAFADCRELTSVTIPDGVTSIGKNAFEDCSGLTSLVIPNSVTNIEESAFEGCNGLTSLTISNGLTTITKESFKRCSGLTTLSIPSSVTTIEGEAFYGCTRLTVLTIPNSVTSIIDDAFEDCTGLTSVTIGSGLTSINYRAFHGCIRLNSIQVASDNTHYDSREGCNAIIETSTNTMVLGCKGSIIPNSVISIGESAFYDCKGLSSITIPNSVTSIGQKAFFGCSGLTEVRSFIVEPFAINTNVFPNASQATLYVPIGTKEKYEATTGWKEFKEIVEMDLDPTDGGEVSYGEGGSIDGETDLSGTVVDNMFYSIGTDAGGYSAEEGCIVITQETSNEQMEMIKDLGITDAELQQNFTGIIFKVPEGKGTVTVTAQTTGNMTLKVKVGNGETVEMELEGKLKMKFPYNVSEESMVYIFAGTTEESAARGAAANTPSLKIYGIEVKQDSGTPTGIDSLTPNPSPEGEGSVYTLGGQRLDAQPKKKGVYIRGGKKVVR